MAKPGGSKYFPGLGNAYFIHPNHVNNKGGARKFMPGIGSGFIIKQSEISSKGGAEKQIYGLGTKFFIDPKYVNHTVTFTVVDELDAAVEGAAVVFNGRGATTDADGVATFDEVAPVAAPYSYSYSVSMEDMDTVSGTIQVSDADVEQEVTMVATAP